MDYAFWTISGITVLGALLAVTLRNLVHCVLSLILFFLGIAAHYFLLRADFIGAVQILIYIGAVAVLILFAIMLTRNVTGEAGPQEVVGVKWWIGSLCAALTAGLISFAVRADSVAETLSPGPKATVAVADIGKGFVGNWIVPFEAMAVLLTAALIGAVVIALEEVRNRR
ncbi:MAG: NADH-quinone oxidoreductase subunit J [Verrucomicrobiae bacterium]|nr:NADH-quinone oxidoreductase subunit J [Verrucomicrobiae bacterium]